MRWWRLLEMLLPAAFATAASAQTAPDTPAEVAKPFAVDRAVDARIAELPALLRGESAYDRYFAPEFRAQVPRSRFDALGEQFAVSYGALERAIRVRAISPWSAELRLDYAEGTVTAAIAIDPAAPHLVTGLRFTAFNDNAATVEAVTSKLAALHGATGFAFTGLGTSERAPIASHQPDRAFAVGSAFKLVILAELVRATNAGERRWTDMAMRNEAQLPGGAYFATPKGTQISLAELAEKMISVSDNSATDILLRTLGRDKIEAMLPVLGVADPARNRPFLETLEAFKLKYLDNGSYGRRYAALDEAGKRALLAGDFARIPLIATPPPPPGGPAPAMIDQIEWLFSAADLVRIMDWLRRNSEGPQGVTARAILSKNPGIPPAIAGKWQWVGYKGGSEPGVMNMTLLLQAKSGDWYALAASWNDTARAVEEARFVALISRFAELATP